MIPPRQSLSVPIHTAYVAKISSGPQFGMGPFGLKGLKSNCGCSPVSGCGCGNGSGLSGFAIGPPSLDNVIQDVFSWLSGVTQSTLPPSASVPPQYGSTGAISTQLQQYIPYLILGWIAYKVLK